MREPETGGPWNEPARLNAHGELEPLAVDESMTTLLFAPRPAPARRPAASARQPERASDARLEPVGLSAALFEMV